MTDSTDTRPEQALIDATPASKSVYGLPADISELIRTNPYAQKVLADSAAMHAEDDERRRREALLTRLVDWDQHPSILNELSPEERELIPLLPDIDSPEPYPIESLPPAMRKAALAIAAIVQAPIGLAGQCVIAAQTALAQTRVNAPDVTNPDGMPCSLFQLSLADSGDRKSSCRRLAFRVIDIAEHKARSAYQLEAQRIKDYAKGMAPADRAAFLEDNPCPPDPSSQFSDVTFEGLTGRFLRGMPAACWDTDEGGQVLGGASLKADTRAATLGGLTKAFDRGGFDRTRSQSNGETSGYASDRRLSIHMLAQQVTVASALADPLLSGQGFLPRFLFTSTESLAGSRFQSDEKLDGNQYSDRDLNAYWDNHGAMLESPDSVDPDTHEVRPPVMGLDAAARAVWLDEYNDIERQQGPTGDYATIKPFAGRAGELIRRLATVFAHSEGRATIDANNMRGACAVVRHSLNEWLRYTTAAKPSPVMVKAQALIDWVLGKGWTRFDKDILRNQGPTRNNAKARDELLAVLSRHHYLLTADGKRFFLNPAVLENSAQSAQSAQTQQIRGFASAQTVRTKCAELSEQPPEALPAENLRTSAHSLRTRKPSKHGALRTISEDGFPTKQDLADGYDPEIGGWVL